MDCLVALMTVQCVSHSHDLVDHYASIITGLLTYFVPCYVVGKNAEAVDGSCILHCLAFYIPLLNWYCIANVRSKIRDRHGIEVSNSYQ